MENRCPQCNKFVPLETELEPEEAELTGDEPGDLKLSWQVRVVRKCGECGEEMKEATLDIEVDEVRLIEGVACVDGDAWASDAHGEPEVSVEDPEVIEEGGGRYAKSYYGASAQYTITCKCGETLYEGVMSEKEAASGFDDLT